jgi:hypothetical protein
MQGTAVMDRYNRIGRRERREILKSTQGLGKGVVAVDKGQLEPLRPNTILRTLEESIARRFREGHNKCATLCSQSRSSWQSQRSREPHAPTWSVPLLERVLALCLRVLSVRSRAGLLGVCLVGHIGDRQLAIAGSTTVSVAIARIIGITDE